MKDIEELKNSYGQIEDANKRFLFLLDNKDDIFKIDENANEKNFNIKAKLLTELSFEYSNKSRYSEANNVFRIVVDLYETHYKENINEVPYYENLLWNYARSLYELKKYKKAEKELKKLHGLFPQNESYKDWYVGTIRKRTWNVTQYFAGYIILFIVINHTIKDQLDYWGYMGIYVLAGISLATSLTLETIGYIKRLRIKSQAITNRYKA
ncbi:hypothetical protein E9993_17860 [Labilibacter sediminis]|nr:hypothetical protein E9993_17860 [Labilibacter sediminis]